MFGARVRRVRVAKRLSQENARDRAGLDRTYISELKRGVRNPTITIVARFFIAKALGVSASSLLKER